MGHQPRHPNALPNGDRKVYNLRNILELKLAGWSYRKIARYYGKDVSTIYTRLGRLRELADQEALEAYEAHRVPILKLAQWRLLNRALDDKTMLKANLGNFFYGFEKLDNAIRLETGQSTANISIHAIVTQLDQEYREKRTAPPQDVVDVPPTDDVGEGLEERREYGKTGS